MKTLFQGGTVVSGTEMRRMDVLVEDERILAVGENLKEPGAHIVDVSQKLVFPGFIDGHTHMDLEVSGTVTADGFETGTKAELAGGTTCLIDFATQNKGETLDYALKRWHRKAEGRASCDYAFHLAISDWNEEVSRELDTVAAGGVRSFKLYMTYDAMVLDDQSLYEVLARLKELNGIAGVHCENRGIIDARLKAALKERGHRRDTADYPATRPDLAEAEAISRLLKIARCVDTPVIIVHLSSREGYEEIRRARAAGQSVYVETCPQYLVMDESRYYLPKGEGRKYMCAPPLRKPADQETLWKALAAGQIQTIATDHCSFTIAQKQAGAEDFAKTPCGMPGAEERPALVYHYGVHAGRLTEMQMCALLAENPARLYRLYPQKGVIAPGSDADLVIWDPKAEHVLSREHQQSAADYCPLEGVRLKGRAAQVYLRGRLAARDGKIVAARAGRYVTAKPGEILL